MFGKIVARTLRVPKVIREEGFGETVARQLDIALLKVGFKLSHELLEYLSYRNMEEVAALGRELLSVVRELVGDHIAHNPYFLDFPANVPDTVEFWVRCLRDAFEDAALAEEITADLEEGYIDLYKLPLYGKVQHSYAQLLAAHAQFMPALSDRITVLHLGGTLEEEAVRLYHQLAGSRTPLSESDLELLRELAKYCAHLPQPEKFPVRENKAVVNATRLECGLPLLADTVTDILRLACALCPDGDVTLATPTRFVSFTRKQRKALLAALNRLIEQQPAKLADVRQYSERWKRLGEWLHPAEYKQFPYAQQAFAVARGELVVRSLAGQVEVALADGNFQKAIRLLENAPGMLMRRMDHLARESRPETLQLLLETFERVAGKVSARVLLSLREHLLNRQDSDPFRLFPNKSGRAWVVEGDEREPLDPEVVAMLVGVIDWQMLQRLPSGAFVVVDPLALRLAIPLSGKANEAGMGVVNRGSMLPVAGKTARIFVYWQQADKRTDWDLSLRLLGPDFTDKGHVSWTQLRHRGGSVLHSGDVTSAPHGATEFIDMDFTKLGEDVAYVVPQVLVYAGENFGETSEGFFGFMVLDREQQGMPFEPRTVRMKSGLRGKGNVCLPLAFTRNAQGQWEARWLNFYMKGEPQYNRVEGTKVTASKLTAAALTRHYLDVDYIVDLLACTGVLQLYDPNATYTEPVIFIGLEEPENLPEGSVVYTPLNLASIIPD